MSSFSSILGIIGTLLGIVRAFPQLTQLLKSRKAHGVSADTAGTSSVVSFGWVIYGVLTNQPFVTLATGSSGTIFALITFFALRFGRSFREIKVTPIWLIALSLALWIGGEAGLGIALPVSVLIANLPQLWVAYKEEDLSNLSLETWLFSTSDGLIWGSYAILEQDIPIMIYGTLQFITSGMIAMLKISKRRKKDHGATNAL